MVDALLDPWRDETTRRALVEVVLLAVVAGPLSCWIVLYRLSYGAESLAHGMLPGLVVAALTGVPLVLGGAAGLLVAAGAVALAARVPRMEADTAIAVVVTGLFGLGALLALSPDTPAGLGELLFGDVLALDDGDLWLAGALAVAVVAVLAVTHHGLLAVGFDRGSARALGRAPLVADLVLGVLLAAALLVAVQGLGNLLVVAVLVAPAAAARRLADRLVPMMALATAIAVVAGVAGLYASYHLHTAAGASVAAGLVAAALLGQLAGASRGSWRTRRGAPRRARRRRTPRAARA